MSRSKSVIRRILALVTVAVMATVCLGGCGGSGTKTDTAGSGEKPGTIIEETDSSITVIDQANREVTVKKNPESIALCYRVAIRFLLSLDQGDKITGIGKTEDFLEMLQPSLKDCADVGKGVVDIEALAELKPDLFFHKASDVEGLEAVQEIGIPAVGIEIETPEDILVALDLMGKVCGAQEKARELADYYNNQLDEIGSITAQIKEKDKATAIVMGSSIGKVADGTMLQGEMLEKAGAVNCASELEATELWPTAGTEQIFAWNPEYIFISNSESAVYDADDIMKDKNWSEMEAVKKKYVKVMPAQIDSWEFPGVVSVLGIYYMIHEMYPELVSDEMLENKVNEFYELSYGRTFEREELRY